MATGFKGGATSSLAYALRPSPNAARSWHSASAGLATPLQLGGGLAAS
jgi:hypothetical protein